MYRMMLIAFVATSLLLAGCGAGQTRDTTTGAALGAATGAAIGSLSANAGKGAAIGAGAGALGGYLMSEDEPASRPRAGRNSGRVCARGYYLNQRGRCVPY
ncbi:MAG: hypothetical protein JXM75_02625 [Chromatiaceae bacterium]|nr:hypothetical protein [Chromatiaceae bacterium]